MANSDNSEEEMGTPDVGTVLVTVLVEEKLAKEEKETLEDPGSILPAALDHVVILK